MSVLSGQLTDLQTAAAAIVRAYERKLNFTRDVDSYAMKPVEEMGELIQAYLQHTGRRQSDGQTRDQIWANVENQATDVLMYLLIFCRHTNIDLLAALQRKWFVFADEIEDGLSAL